LTAGARLSGLDGLQQRALFGDQRREGGRFGGGTLATLTLAGEIRQQALT
jgi:hypothetical protein